MSHSIGITIVAAGIALMVPVLWAALGEVIVETGGVLNIGIEGVMIFGAFASAAMLYATHSVILATAIAFPTGALCGVVLAYLYVYRATDQIATGLMFNILALGITAILSEKYLTGIVAGEVTAGHPVRIPLLAHTPLLGPTFFTQTVAVYAAIAAAPVVFFALRRTWFGLHLRTVGQRPLVAEVAGINVFRLRAVALVTGCIFVALGGASIIVTQSGTFLPGITSGQGFIAIAIVVLGRFNPLLIVGGAMLFGIATAFEFAAQTISIASALPSEFWTAVPYLITIIAVAIGKEALYPKAIGLPYIRPGTSTV